MICWANHLASETTWLPIYIWGSRVIYKKDAPEPAQPTEPGMVKQLNAPAAVVATPPTTVERRLGDLDDLKRRGVISEAEHEAQRNRILEDL